MDDKPSLPPALTKAIHYAILTVLFVGGLGPTVAQMSGLLPARWFAAASHAVAVCAGLALYLTQSPLVRPFLPQPSVDAKRMASLRPPMIVAAPLPPLPPIPHASTWHPPADEK
jgi:hypothetical protein